MHFNPWQALRFRVARDGSRLLQGALGVKTQSPSTFGSLKSVALAEVQLNMLASPIPTPCSTVVIKTHEMGISFFTFFPPFVTGSSYLVQARIKLEAIFVPLPVEYQRLRPQRVEKLDFSKPC